MKPRHTLPALLLPLIACSAGSADPPDPAPPLTTCALDADCPTGLLCREAACVSAEDLLPPELEVTRTVASPVAVRDRLFLLSADTGNVLVVDPADLSIEPVVVPAEPIAMANVPDRDALVVLSRRSLTVVGFEDGEITYRWVDLSRRHGALSVSPDGRYAVAYTPEGTAPSDGAEGRVAVVDLERLIAGEEVTPYELGAGYRHTNIFYRMERGVATLAIVVGKDAVASVELASGRVERIELLPSLAEVVGREVIALEGGRYLLVRGLGLSGIGVVDVDASSLTIVPFAATPTDLEVSVDGMTAIVALRSANQLAILDLPDALTSTASIRTVAVDAVAPGQLELAADGRVVVFSSQEERLAVVDLIDDSVEVLDRLRKKIQTVSIAPDGATAVLFHRAEPDSTVADVYEREVDRDEAYSIVDLVRGGAQLERTGRAVPSAVVFGASSRFAAVIVTDPPQNEHRVDRLDLETLTSARHRLGSAPEFVGGFGGADERVWITQDHAAGRLSVLDLLADELQTLTGYELNAGVQ